jgi:hypothetical protein
VLVTAELAGLLSVRVTPSSASPHVRTNETITSLANGDLMVHLDNPALGQSYAGTNILVVPTGFQWHLLTVCFNITTAPSSTGAAGSRRLKFVLSDTTDLVGNSGRAYTIVFDSLKDYVFKDISLSLGQNSDFGKAGPGAANAVLRSPMQGALPDQWVPAGFAWQVSFEGGTDRDQMSEFYALVEQKPV